MSSQRDDMALRVSKTFPCTTNWPLVLVEVVTGTLFEGADPRGTSFTAGVWVAASSACILLAELLAGAAGGEGGGAAAFGVSGVLGVMAGALFCNCPGNGGGAKVFGASTAAAAAFCSFVSGGTGGADVCA